MRRSSLVRAAPILSIGIYYSVVRSPSPPEDIPAWTYKDEGGRRGASWPVGHDYRRPIPVCSSATQPLAAKDGSVVTGLHAP